MAGWLCVTAILSLLKLFSVIWLWWLIVCLVVAGCMTGSLVVMAGCMPGIVIARRLVVVVGCVTGNLSVLKLLLLCVVVVSGNSSWLKLFIVFLL